MDPSSRPPPRERVHNPNYPPRSPRSTYPSFQAPPISQPPPQQPPFDPFHRSGRQRDPFLPSFSSKQRDQQPTNLNGRLPEPHPSEAFHHAPPPPPSPFRIGQLPYSDSRRNSLPGSHHHGPHEPSQPHGPVSQSPSIFSRQMPPPSTSPKYETSHPPSRSSSIVYPYDNPGANRQGDVAASGRTSRSNGSMSINSLVDQGPASQPQPNTWAQSSKTSSHVESQQNSLSQPGSPPGFGYRSDRTSGQYTPRGRLEDREQQGVDERDRMRSPLGPLLRGGETSEKPVHGFSRLLQPFHHSPSAVTANHQPRPLSQPVGPESSSRDVAGAGPRDVDPRMADHYGGEYQQDFRYDNRLTRERAFSDAETGAANPSVPVGGKFLDRPMYGRLGETFARDGPAHARPAFEDRELFPPSSTSASDGVRAHMNGPGAPEASPGVNRHDMYHPQSQVQAQHDQRLAADQAQITRPSESFPGARVDHPTKIPGSAVDSQLRQSIEDNRAHHRSFLGILNESNNRNERASPLPQAVQGAQSQPAGSGRDPSIKSEFGRMFSGLGSGVGSTPQPLQNSLNGAPPPRHRSPLEGDREDRSNRRETKASVPSRATGPGSRGGRKVKRPLEDTRADGDNVEGRYTPSTGSRATKRNKYTQPPVPHHHHHHHHHPVVPHHHHHHHHRPDEDVPNSTVGRNSAPRYNPFRFPTPSQVPAPTSQALPPPPPHHHHSGLPPQTLQPPKTQLPPPLSLKVMTSPLLRSVSNLPRKHLGSQIYKASFSIPAAATTTIDSTHMVETSPNLLPRFERNKSNSTFTIRVPRYYLKDARREQLCASRRIWGTEVYTDDSDPVCAAIHSGWIRGAWKGDVDIDMILGLDSINNSGGTGVTGNGNGNDNNSNNNSDPTDVKKPTDSSEQTNQNPARTLNAPPLISEGGPIIPPTNLDLHLTLLILPPLNKYDSSVWHGVKSHSWGDNHDGMSFKVMKIEWVDDNGCVEDRNPKAIKKRAVAIMKETQRVKIRSKNGLRDRAGLGMGGVGLDLDSDLGLSLGASRVGSVTA